APSWREFPVHLGHAAVMSLLRFPAGCSLMRRVHHRISRRASPFSGIDYVEVMFNLAKLEDRRHAAGRAAIRRKQFLDNDYQTQLSFPDTLPGPPVPVFPEQQSPRPPPMEKSRSPHPD